MTIQDRTEAQVAGAVSGSDSNSQENLVLRSVYLSELLDDQLRAYAFRTRTSKRRIIAAALGEYFKNNPLPDFPATS